MKLKHSAYMSQYKASFEVPPSGPGYDIETLKRMSLLDNNRELDVFQINIKNEREEESVVFVRQEDLLNTVSRLLSPAFTPGATGVTRLTITI